MRSTQFIPLMNNTKWNEIREEILNYDSPPKWRTKDLNTGYISLWDNDWFYHFSEGGYDSIELLEIHAEEESIKTDLIQIMKKIHVPGEVFSSSIKVYGYKKNDEFVDYI
jgi:hypothetical protein